MHTTLTTLLDRLDSAAAFATDVIRWASPVPSFGDLSRAKVATVGLNPSNREFVDVCGDELAGTLRRFHTLNSLGINSWLEADARHLRLILDSCSEYFNRSPYDLWFKRLDRVISAVGSSFYGDSPSACHLDLIPYATASKWTELTGRQRSLLLAMAADSLGLLLRDSDVVVLILNGQSVVAHFQQICGVCMQQRQMRTWSLARKGKFQIPGIGYTAVIDKVAGLRLPHKILVLGYNHNLQSSFGVTNEVIGSIGAWAGEVIGGAIS